MAQTQVELFVNQLVARAAEVLPNIIGAMLLLIAGLWFAGFAQRGALRLIQRTGKIDPTLETAFAVVVRYAIMVVVIVAVLSQLGIQTTSILAALGAAGLAIGLALQGTLANVAAGLMLLWLRPFKLGDYIDADGVAGTVKAIGLFSTELHSWDGIFQFVPNSQLWNKRVTNFTRLPTRLLELKFGIAYEDDVRRAKEVLEQMVSEETRVLDEPAPQVLVYELGDSALVLAVRVWTKTSDYWAARWALTEAGKLRLETAGLSIPFPQRDVHIVGGAPSPDNQSAA
jgi:small conductance mechanosensitive channel